MGGLDDSDLVGAERSDRGLAAGTIGRGDPAAAARRARVIAHSARRARALAELGLRPGVSWEEVRGAVVLRSATIAVDRRAGTSESDHQRLNRTYAVLRLLAVD